MREPQHARVSAFPRASLDAFEFRPTKTLNISTNVDIFLVLPALEAVVCHFSELSDALKVTPPSCLLRKISKNCTSTIATAGTELVSDPENMHTEAYNETNHHPPMALLEVKDFASIYIIE